MAFDDAINGSFDPTTAIDDLISKQDGAPATGVSPDFLANRLYRKLKQPDDRAPDEAPKVQRPTNLKPKSDAPDFSSQGVAADSLPDFADQGTPIDQMPVQAPAPTAKLGVTGQAKAALKGIPHAAIEQTGGVLKGLGVASAQAQREETPAMMASIAGGPPELQPTTLPPPVPTAQQPYFRAGQAVQDFANRAVPMTEQEKASIGGRIGQGIGGVAPYVAAGAINPLLGVAAGAGGMAASSAADTYDAAIAKGASEEKAAAAAGYSALVGGALGALPLGMVLKPIRIASPMFAGRAAGYLEEAVKSGLTFATVGEAQEYLLQRIAKDYYDPEAGYSPDAKRAIASLITGGILGAGGHFMERRAQRAAGAPEQPSADAAAGGPPPGLGGPGPDTGPASPGAGPSGGGGPSGGPTSPGGAPPRPDAERSGVGRDKLEKILKYYGYSAEDIAAMSHAEMSAAVLREMQGGAGPKAKPAGAAPEQPQQPKAEASSKQEAPKQGASSTEAAERDGLKRYGWSDDEIDQMSPTQRRREFQDAMASGQSEKPEDANLRKNASSAPAEANKAEDIAEGLKGMGAGIGDSLRDHLWQRVQAGETSEGRGMGASPLLQGAKMLREKGGLQTREQFDAYANDQSKIEGKGPAFQQAMRDLLAKHLPGEASGKREAPIRPTTTEDVQRAQPVEPVSPAQAAAENYQHAHLELPQLGLEGGRSISIETGVGQERKGIDSDGKPWSVKLTHAAYGRIKGTNGADGQPLDIFVGPHPTSTHVFVVDQHHPGGGGFDEHKILAGFRTPIDALHAYAHSYTDQGKDRIGHVTAMGPDEFKQWLASDTTKPLKQEPASAGHPSTAETGPSSFTEAAADTAVPKESPTGAGAAAGGSIRTIPDEQTRSSTKSGNFKGNIGAAEPLSLLQFLASKGGVAPHSELRALDLAGDHRVQLPGRSGFFGVVRPAGMPLDTAREAAEEAGYLKGEHNKTSTVRDLLDAIDTELRGGRHAAEGEEGHTTKHQRGSERERSDAAREKAIEAAREDIAAEYTDLPADLLDRAATIMADERLDIDGAVEMAAVRMVAEDADYGVSASDLQDIFGEDVTDAIRPRSAPANGGSSGEQRSPEQRSEEGEKAGANGAPVRDLGEAGREEATARSGSEETAERVAGFTPSQMRSLLSDEQEQVVNMWHQVREPMPANASEHYKSNIRAMRQELAKDGFNRARTEDELRDMLMDQRLSGEMVKATKPEKIDQTEAGEQRVLPGAEKIGQGEQAQRAAEKPLTPTKAQKAADQGLFGDERNQTDLLDHMRTIEKALGTDADRVAPVDVARAAEIMAEQPGIEPADAFGQAVIKNAVEQGFLTEQQAVDAYGEEVTSILEPGREGAPGSGAHTIEGGAEPDQASAGGAAEGGELPRRSEAGAQQGAGAEEAKAVRADEGAAAAGRGQADQQGGNAAENQPAAETARRVDDQIKTVYEAIKQENGGISGAMIGDLLFRTRLPKDVLHKWIMSRVQDGSATIHPTTAGYGNLSKIVQEAAINLPGHEPLVMVVLKPEAFEAEAKAKKAREASRGVQIGISPSDAPAGASNVQSSEPRGKAGSVRGREGEAGNGAIPGTDQGRAEGAGRVSEGAVRERGDGSRDADADRLSEPRADDAAERREKRATERAANLVDGENHVIEPGSLDEARGPMAKARGNVEALELANKILAEDRPATAAEQKTLAQYVGWGGLKGAFPDGDGKFASGFETIGKRLQELLPEDEYATARRSIQYAHYTAEDVVRGMWDAVGRLGFKGGQVFEPGMGTGNFAGMMPSDIAANSHYAGLELDHTTARIAKLLYPKWGIRQDDFTKTRLPADTFDLVIGNPPFADIAIKSDPAYKQGFLLHDYFFAKSLDAVRPGGLLAFVTSAGTMNKIDPGARNYLADRADLVGAVRLPGGAFEKNAGTKVTIDILFLRKRLPADVPGDRGWTETRAATLPNKNGEPITGAVSSYFLDHPEMVLGEHGFFDPLYEDRYAVKSRAGQDIKADLAAAIERLPQDVMTDWQDVNAESVKADFTTAEKKEGTYYVGPDGNLHQVSGGVGMPVKQRGKGVEGGRTAGEIERIKGLVPVRDALRDVYAADLAGDTGNAQRAREALNRHYDAFVEKFGPINKAVIQTRRPNVIQQESERQQAREDARYAGQRFREGDFDDRKLVAEGATTSVIARERQKARDAAAAAGRPFDEGDFDPNEVPDVIIDKRPNVDAFMDDPESYRLRAIERYNEGTGQGHKSPVFFENIITREKPPEIKSTNDALLYSLSKFGRVNISEMAAMLRKSPSEVIESLGDQIFQTPGTADAFETRDEYLSGNVRKKLTLAKKAAERNPAFRRNVDALEASQPIPLPPSQIHATLGMPWVPQEDVQKFGTDALGLEKLNVRYLAPLAQWVVSGDTDSVSASTTWGTADRRAPALIQDALNRQNPKIYDHVMVDGRDQAILNVAKTEAAQDKVKAIQEKFADWIWSDQERADRLAGMYNEKFNNLVVRDYDGSYLTTPGISATWSWRPHQKRVIARIIQSGNTYVAHAVGAGKTSEYIGAIMEMRRLCLVRKPMVAVPNHMLGQFTKEWYEQYPMAKLAIADDRQFHTDRRKQFIANVATGDLDAVIITHSAFGMIPVSEKFRNSMIQEEISQYREMMAQLTGSDNRITRSRVEKQIERLEQRLTGKGNKRKDSVFTFEEMGIDHLTVDEAHLFRKLDFATQMSNLKGVSPDGSDMAWDLYTKAQYLDKMRPGRSLVLGSGTPITNTMAELYSLQRYMQPQVLAERGIEKFDAWAGAFGESVSELEQDAAGNYKPVSRFAKFVNVAELSAMVRQVMDVVTSRQLEQYVTRPQIAGGKRQMHLAEKSEQLEAYQANLAERMKAIQERKGPPQKGDDIMLTVINDGRHAAIDMRLAGGSKSADHPSKLDMMVDNVFNIWKVTKAQPLYRPAEGGGYETKPAMRGPGTQLLFTNLGLSGKRGFSVPDYIRSELSRRGVPKSEIAYIYDHNGQTQKQRLFNDMNEGKVRILIGSVAKMGVGTNVQRRLTDIHNMDPLWYPSDDEQRNGRGIRQGNMNPEIGIHDYSTKGTYDSTMWGMMAKKAKFIQGFFEGDPSLREMDDLGEASQYEQAKALTTNDPRLIRFTELKQELERAMRRKTAFDSEVYATRTRRADAKSHIEHYSKRIDETKADISQRIDTSGDNFKGKIGKKTLDKRTEFIDALWDRTGELLQSGARNNPVMVGEIGGFPIWAEVRKGWIKDSADFVHIWLEMNGAKQREIESTTPRGTLQSMEATLKNLPNDLAEYQARLSKAQKFFAESEAKANAKFEGQGEINQLARQVREMEADLKGEKPEPSNARGSLGQLIAHRLSEEQIARVEKLITDVIHKMVGTGVRVRINRDLIGFEASARAKWGELGKDAEGATGMFYPWRRIIELALTDKMDSTAFHEAYHAIEYLLQTPQERELMKRETPRLREYLKRTRPDYTPEMIDGLADEEVRANAFEDYADAKRQGKQNAGNGIHMMLRRLWDRLIQALHQIKNGLRGMGFKSYEDIFEKAREGGYADAKGESPRAEAVPPEGWQEPTMASIFRRRQDDAINTRIKDLMTSTAVDRFVERYQNLSKPVQRLQEAVEAKLNGTLPDTQAFYQKKRLFPGKVAVMVQDFNKQHLDPIIKAAKDAGLSLPDVGDILYALHAPERNAAMEEINHPALDGSDADVIGKRSGMSDEHAAEILARHDPALVERLDRMMQSIRDFNLDTQVEAGLLSAGDAAAYRQKYSHYVPLSGWDVAPEDQDQDQFHGNGAFNVRGKETQRAFGRKSKAANPLQNALEQSYRTIERAKRNEYLRSLRSALGALDPEEMKGFARFDQGKPKKVIDPMTGLVMTAEDPFYRNEPGAVGYKVGGHQRYVIFENRELGEAIKRMHADGLGMFQPLLTIQNKLKSLWTHYSPDFLLRHFLFRYPIEGALNSFEQKDDGDHSVATYIKQAIPFLGSASRAIFAENKGRAATGEAAELQQSWRILREAGGSMTFRSMRDSDLLREHLEKALNSLNRSPLQTAKDKWQASIEAMDVVTNALDNSLRLAAGHSALKQGKTPEQAALIAREATVDFQQVGKWKNAIGLWFPFGNIAIQTGARMTSAMYRSKTMRRVFMGTMLASFLSGMFNYLVGGDDKDGIPFQDKIPEWDRHLNFIIINPFHRDEKGRPVPIKIPMPYNWSLAQAMGTAMATIVFGKDKHRVRNMLAMVTKAAIEVATPFGQEENMAAMLAPELTRPFIHAYTNKDWSGKPVHQDETFQKGPNSYSGRKNTGDGWKYIAQGANDLTGGDKHHAGALDFYPEDLRLMFDYIGGSQRRFAENVATSVTKPPWPLGESSDYTHVPLARVVLGNDYDAADRARRFERSKEAKQPWKR